jgi:hypothetical protein
MVMQWGRLLAHLGYISTDYSWLSSPQQSGSAYVNSARCLTLLCCTPQLTLQPAQALV